MISYAVTYDGSCQYFGCMVDTYDPIYNVPSEEACDYFGLYRFNKHLIIFLLLIIMMEVVNI